MHAKLSATACLTLASLLSACGGGGSDTTPPVSQPQAPIALADTVSVNANQETTLNVLANDSQSGNPALELVSVGTPAHGTAALKNGALVYTPAAGYYGPDKVSYTMRAVGSSLSATADATIAVGMPLRLSGKDGLPAATGGTVTVTAGTRAFTRTVAAGAMYDIPVVLEAPGQMVTVTVQATGAGYQHIKMISLAGDAATLVAASGGSGTLAAPQRADLNVSLVSTGKYVALRRLNGAAVPANAAELAAAMRFLPPLEVLQTAALLRLTTVPLLGQPALALPGGMHDTLELALNTPVYTAYAKSMVQAHGDQISNAVRDLVEDFSQQTTSNLAIDGTRTLSLLPIGLDGGAYDGIDLTLNTNGSAQLALDGTISTPAWSKYDDVLALGFGVPLERTNVLWKGVSAEQLVGFIQVRQMSGGPEGGLMTITMSGIVLYTDNTGPHQELFSQTMAVLGVNWDSLPALTTQDIAGKTLAGLPDMISPPGALAQNQMRMAFAADGTATMVGNSTVNASWIIQDGKLRVAFNDGSVQLLSPRRLNTADDVWVARYFNGATGRVFEMNMAIVQPGLAFTLPSQVAQNWTNVGGDYEGIQTDFHLMLASDGLGTETVFAVDGSVASSSNSSWVLDNGRAIITVYRLPDGTRASACPTGLVCTFQPRRAWTLLRQDGDIITVLDNYTNRSGDWARVARYRRHPG